jgi:outer membrane protein OmpA-like peptidoglycan-associated protein
MRSLTLILVTFFLASTAFAVDLGGLKAVGSQVTATTSGNAAELLTKRLKKVQNEKGPIRFKTGTAEIDPVCDPTMQTIADIIREVPGYHVQVDGHTDNVGKAESNQKLSQQRATAVVNYLVGKKGIEAKRLSAKGWGASAPIADNGTEAGRAKNRRVDFTVRAL